jgi:hypothetical protein
MMDNSFDSSWKDVIKIKISLPRQKIHFQFQFEIGKYR